MSNYYNVEVLWRQPMCCESYHDRG